SRVARKIEASSSANAGAASRNRECPPQRISRWSEGELAELAALDGKHHPIRHRDARDHRTRVALHDELSRATQDPGEAAHAGAECRAAGNDSGERAQSHADFEHGADATASELIAVAPRGELRPQRPANANELEPLAQPRHADVVGGHAQLRRAEAPLALFNGFPALIQRREVPPLTLATHDPESPPFGVERQASPDGERLDHLIRSEGSVAEETGRKHRSSAAS